nr:hypothetical protein [uncultured Noviherbaspirillum sp.]
MNRTRSTSAAETLRPEQPAAPAKASATAADINQLGIRILAIKSIPVQEGARLKALLDCAVELKRMPQRSMPLLVGELVDACAALSGTDEIRALKAVFGFQKPPAWSV